MYPCNSVVVIHSPGVPTLTVVSLLPSVMEYEAPKQSAAGEKGVVKAAVKVGALRVPMINGYVADLCSRREARSIGQ